MGTVNGVMLQYFHWYTPSDGSLWRQLNSEANRLAKSGFTSVWLPPAYKGVGGKHDVGYGIYDRYDLGEFDQKNTVRTKYGTKEEYVEAISTAQSAGLQVYADIVLNHMLGADHLEEAEAIPMNPANRNEALGEMRSVKTWTHFTFPGRQKTYSDREWHWWDFDAVDHAEYDESEAIYLFKGKTFDNNVDQEKGSFDYLMGCDLDVEDPEVQHALKEWGTWYIETTKVDGFRFDAVKHVKASFFSDWLKHCRQMSGKQLFAVGEYWSHKIEALHHFIDCVDGNVMLFDAPLHYNFHQASRQGDRYDMRKIFDNSLVKQQPNLAVTLVENHDSQPLQSLESVVEGWFKPLAYALILLRRDGYPCVFIADYYGAHYKDIGSDGKEYEIWLETHQWLIDKFLWVRQNHAFGCQRDYFDHPNAVGWARSGKKKKGGGMAVLMSNGAAGKKWMSTAQPHQTYRDITEHISEVVKTNEDGWGEFLCPAGSLSVWVPAHETEREFAKC